MSGHSTVNEAGVQIGDLVLNDSGQPFRVQKVGPHAAYLADANAPGGWRKAPVVALADPSRLVWYGGNPGQCWRGPTVAAIMPDPNERRRHQRRVATMRTSTLEAIGLSDRRRGEERRRA